MEAEIKRDTARDNGTKNVHHFGRIPAFFFACCPLPFAPRVSCICLNFFLAYSFASESWRSSSTNVRFRSARVRLLLDGSPNGVFVGRIVPICSKSRIRLSVRLPRQWVCALQSTSASLSYPSPPHRPFDRTSSDQGCFATLEPRIHGTTGEDQPQLEQEGQTIPCQLSSFSAAVEKHQLPLIPREGKRTDFLSFFVRDFPDLPTSGSGGGGAGTYCSEPADFDAKFSTLSTSASRARVTLPFFAASNVK